MRYFKNNQLFKNRVVDLVRVVKIFPKQNNSNEIVNFFY